jgi:CBS domain-containing protein
MRLKGARNMPAKAAVAPPPVTSTSLTAKDIMEKPVIASTPRATLRDVASQLVSNEFSGLPVTAEDGRVVGVVTESDIIRILMEGKRLENLTASQVMTGPPVTVDVDTPIEEVMKILEKNRIVRVPVTRNNTLVGIIARRDVIRAVLEPEFMAFGDI